MKKITTILMLLVLTCTGAWAEELNLSAGVKNNGTVTHTNGAVNQGLGYIYVSETTPQVTILATNASGENSNIINRGNGFFIASNISNFEISLPDGYLIQSFTCNIKNNDGIKTITFTSTSGTVSTATVPTTATDITVSDINAQSASFTLTATKNGSPDGWSPCTVNYIKIVYSIDYTYKVETNIKPWIDNIGSGYFTLDGNNDDVKNLQTAYDNHTDDTWTQDQYNELLALLNAAKASENAYIMPKTGYYRIKNTNRGRNSYLAYGLPSLNQNRGSGLVTIDESGAPTDASTIFKLTETADNNYTFGTEGMVVYAPVQNNYPFRTSKSESDAVTYKFTVTSPGVVAIGPADVTAPNAQRYFHEGDDANWGEIHAVVQWEATAGASQWTVEEANKLGQGAYALEIALTTIDSKSYATTYLPFPVTLSDDAEAYTVKIDGKKAVETLLGNEIPAEAPVLLISETAAEKVYATVAEVTTTVNGNQLNGVFVKTAKAELQGETPVVLNQKNSKVGFYKLANGSSLSANRAYLSYVEGTTPQPAKAFFEEGFELGGNEATAIENIENGAFENGAVYNLQGQRVNKAQKGVFIQNGKKVVVK